MQISKELLNDIADSMETGLKCYVHKETLEVISFPDPDRFYDMRRVRGVRDMRQ